MRAGARCALTSSGMTKPPRSSVGNWDSPGKVCAALCSSCILIVCVMLWSCIGIILHSIPLLLLSLTRAPPPPPHFSHSLSVPLSPYSSFSLISLPLPPLPPPSPPLLPSPRCLLSCPLSLIPGALAVGNSVFGLGIGRILLSGVSCIGNESNILQCPSFASFFFIPFFCQDHTTDAGVVCYCKYSTPMYVVVLTELELNIVTMVYDVMSVWFVRMLSVVYIMYMHVETI